MTDLPSKIRCTREDFETAIKLLGGTIYMSPSYCDCRVRAFYYLENGVKVEIHATGNYLNPRDGQMYYARAESWSHVRIELWGDIHTAGKGARSEYMNIRETLVSLLGG